MNRFALGLPGELPLNARDDLAIADRWNCAARLDVRDRRINVTKARNRLSGSRVTHLSSCRVGRRRRTQNDAVEDIKELRPYLKRHLFMQPEKPTHTE